MANKRILKKQIQQVCGDAAVDVLINLPHEVAETIVLKIAKLQSQSLANVSFCFDHSVRDFANAKAYNIAKSQYNRKAYKKLKDDFNAGLKEIVAEINTTLTAEQREANRQAAN